MGILILKGKIEIERDGSKVKRERQTEGWRREARERNPVYVFQHLYSFFHFPHSQWTPVTRNSPGCFTGFHGLSLSLPLPPFLSLSPSYTEMYACVNEGVRGGSRGEGERQR